MFFLPPIFYNFLNKYVMFKSSGVYFIVILRLFFITYIFTTALFRKLRVQLKVGALRNPVVVKSSTKIYYFFVYLCILIL